MVHPPQTLHHRHSTTDTPPPAFDFAPTFKELRKNDDLSCIGQFLPELQETIANSFLSDVETPSPSQEITGDQKPDADFFKNTSGTANNCLVVNWDKKVGSENNNKWQGNFRWVWTFSQGDKALVMFNSLETPPTEAKLKATGGVYFISKGGTNEGNNWKVRKHKRWKSIDSVDATNFDKKFPGAGEGVVSATTPPKLKNYWEFVENKDDLGNICVNCQEDQLPTHKQFRSKGEWKQNGGTHTPMDWVKNSDSWFSEALPDIPNLKSIIENKFKNMKGKWTYTLVEPKPAANA